jgi:Flp pilus assembly pilin Flp
MSLVTYPYSAASDRRAPRGPRIVYRLETLYLDPDPTAAGNSPHSVARFSGPDEGQALAEYALTLAFVFVACILALGVLGLAIVGELDVITAALP